ncbi:MAG TPA: hypothetical protein PKE64_06415 [Anaerolineae bacterium]|nr:hypothetical protein [Anaerolineae bacterium]
MAERYTSSVENRSMQDRVREAASSRVEETQGKAAQATEQAKNKVMEAKDHVQNQAKEAAEARKSQAASEINAVAQALRTSGEEMERQDHPGVANYTNQMAERLERVSSYIEERNVDQLLSEAADFARRRPEVFLGGAFVLGVALGRFLSSQGQASRQSTPYQPANVSRRPTPDYTPPRNVQTYEPQNFAR